MLFTLVHVVARERKFEFFLSSTYLCGRTGNDSLVALAIFFFFWIIEEILLRQIYLCGFFSLMHLVH